MKKDYFWGIFLVLIAAYLIVSRLGYLPAVGVYTIAATIVCIAVFIYSLMHMSFGGMLFSLAFAGILYDEQLGITMITPWTILLAALLGTVGLNLLFPQHRWRKDETFGPKKEDFDSSDSETMDGENIRLRASCGSQIRHITSENLCYMEIDASFCGMKVYFDKAKIPSGNATVNVNASFSGVELYVPSDWTVINHLNSSFGGVSEKGKPSAGGGPTLTLEGGSSFSGIPVYYV